MLIDLIECLPQDVNKELFKDLLRSYRDIKNAYYLKKHEETLSKVTKFVETVFQILSNIAFKEIPKKPELNKISRELENIPEDHQPESIRILIPRVALTLYTVRSKRGVHKNEVSPNVIDSTFAVASCNWIVSEFLRLFLKKEPKEILEIINSLSKIHLPLVEEIADQLVVLRPEMKTKEQVLIILFYKYPEFVSNQDIKKGIINKSKRQIYKTLAELKRDCYIVKTEKGFTLTQRGIEEAEKIQIRYYGEN
ncbi:MAG: hypothetical protein RMH75_07415 [Archaeoglobaceae archaeon]|nr:hypothetical protein [Leptospiraceae bacterium]MDW7990468.1 hypothetical protein [Archaeoglobaceae archaeon]